MSTPRLRVQFETLFERFSDGSNDVHLDDITDTLCCTRRNARLVLNKLEEEGWIEWHPAAGRGKHSKLVFKRNRHDVSENLAKRYLSEGKFGQALDALDKDASRLTRVIQGFLGLQRHEGEQVVRLPYYRSLSMLNPAKPLRRSEQHIAHQLFSGLTHLDDSEQLQPDLAHSWDSLSNKHWRFYLRRGVRFHNGELLTTEHVIESLQRLLDLNLFAHISKVSSPADWVVDIELNRSDKYLPLALSEAQAKILLPEAMRDDSFDSLPIGTGPFQVRYNDESRLVLNAFDGYFGLRPLLDQVEVWVIDEAYSSMVYPTLTKPAIEQRKSNERVELDPGCTFLLINKKSGFAKDPRWCEFFSQALNSQNLYAQMPQDKIVELGLLQAFGIKPGWLDCTPKLPMTPPSENETIRVAYQESHPIFPLIARVIERILSQHQLRVELVGYQEELPESETVDIWVKAMGIATNRDDAIAGWLLDYSNIEQYSPDYDFYQWCELVNQWRSGELASFPAREIGRDLVTKGQVVPMFHCWLGVNQDQSGALQNAKCNALGWFNFSQVWVKPELTHHESLTGESDGQA